MNTQRNFPLPESVRSYVASRRGVPLHKTPTYAVASTFRDYSSFTEAAARQTNTNAKSLAMFRAGDMNAVESADAFMAQVESMVDLPAKAWTAGRDVSGSSAIVPAFMAGHPQAMRRRTRAVAEAAPLCIVADTTGSAGLGPSIMNARGAAMYAAARLLATRRPVDLWVLIGLARQTDGANQSGAYVFQRIATDPLDLARAGFILANDKHTSLGYRYLSAMNPGGVTGWEFSLDGALPPALMGDLFRSAVGIDAGTDILAFPGLYGADEMASRPVEWLRRTLAEYAPDV